MLNDDINGYLGTLSYPFTSIDFLYEDMLQEYYKKENPTVKDKKHIRESTVNYMINRYNVYSYDEIYLYLDKWYLYPSYNLKGKMLRKNSFNEIWKHLEELSKCFISQRDGKIVYKYWKNEDDDEKLGGFSNGNKIYLFHSLNRLIPLDILVSIYMVKNGKIQNELNGYYGNITVSDVLLDQVLEQGVAENHLHSGVSASFSTIWDEIMKPLNMRHLNKIKNMHVVNEFGMNKKSLMFFLLSANILRFYLLLAVKQGWDKNNLPTFPIVFGNKVQLNSQILYFTNSDTDNLTIENFFLEQWNKISDNMNCQDCDIRSILVVQPQLHTSDESLFLHYIISFIYSKNYKDEIGNYFKQLFMNYLRIKNHFYQLVVQQKSIHGLNYFKEKYYRNSSTFNKFGIADASNRWERIIREQLQNENLKKLELRTSIGVKEKNLKKDIVGFLTSYRKILRESYCKKAMDSTGECYIPISPFPKIGIVFHLLKSEQDYLPEKCIKKSDDDMNFLQYGKLYESYKRQIELFLKMRNHTQELDKSKYLDKYLVGIDVASLENAVPTWVFTSIFENARDSRIEPINRISSLNENYQSLGFTFHAGEDFRHILSGLRRIDEVVNFLKFHSGDRIGHGIALGISIEAWHKLNLTIIIPRIEALENYIWAYNILSNSCNSSFLVNLSYIEKRIYEISKEVYGANSQPTINILIDAYIGLFEENFFERMQKYACNCCGDKKDVNESFPNLCEYFSKLNCTDDNLQEQLVWNVEMLKTARHCKKYVYKMNEPIHMNISAQDIEIAKEVQKLVKQNVYRKGVIIEINPSSNLTISTMDTLAENQVFGLSNFGYQFDDLIVCINSDDPAVFNTNVLNEMGYIYFGMLEKGLGRESILNWLEKLRKNGMSASFLRRKDSDIQILHELDELIENL